MTKESFGGAFKKGESLLGPIEKRFVAHWLSKIPKWLETYHLTMMTILWSALVILSAWKVRETGCINWFGASPLLSCFNISPIYLTVR